MKYRLVKTTSTYDGSISYKIQNRCLFWWTDTYDGGDFKDLDPAKELLEKLRSRDAKKTIEVIG